MAHDDIATLGIDIRTERVQNAIHKLEELQGQAKKAETATQQLARETASAERHLSSFGNSISGLVASLRGLATSIMSCYAAYKAFNGLKNIATTGVRFNSSMESAKIGIGSLVTSMATLADEEGNVLTGMDKYVAGQRVAADMMKELQVLGLETTATTQELVEGMQVVMAPALRAGMELKKIPAFATHAAQALQTMGLPLQQMRTELTALLTGRVTGNDLLAPALFSEYSKDELHGKIEELKQAGQLIPEIEKRLSVFDMAGKDVANTFTGLASNLEEAFEVVAGKSTEKLTAKLKDVLKISQELLIKQGNGETGISKDFEYIAEAIEKVQTAAGEGALNAVTGLVNALKDLNSYLGMEGVDNLFNSLSDGAKVAGAALAALLVVRKANAASIGAFILAERQKTAATLQGATATTTAGTGLLRYQSRLTAATAANVVFNGAARLSSNILKGFVGTLGGPWGLVLTAGAAGLTYLATRQDTATAAVQASSVAFESYAAVMRKVKDDTDGYTKKLDEMTKAELAAAQADNKRAQELVRNSLNSKIQSVFQASYNEVELPGLFDFEGKEYVPKKFTDQLSELWNSFRSGKSTADEFKQEMLAFYAQVQNSEYGTTQFAQALREMVKDAENGVPALARLQSQGSALAGVMNTVAGAIRQVGAALQGLGAVDFGDIGAQAQRALVLSGLKGGDKAFVQALYAKSDKDKSFTAEQVEQIAKGVYPEGTPEVVKKALEEARKKYRQADANNQASKSGGSAKSIDSATESIRRFREEIDQLNGVSSKSTGQLSKKLVEIEKAGKEAKMAAPEIAKFKEEYKEAFQADTLKKFNKELLQMEGRTAELHKLEVAEKLQEWRNQLEGLGLPAEETEQRLAKMQAALNTQSAEKDFQTSINFYKELAEMSGNYTQLMDLQTQAIERQGEAYIRAGIDEHLVRQWEALQKLQQSRDPFAGMTRGLQKYADEATNLGQQMEHVVTNTFQGMEDAFVKFTETGKLSFSDLANSIISDLMRIAIRATITGPLAQGVNSLLGGLFSGGAADTSAAGEALLRQANGGVWTGGTISDYANSIISTPTYFNLGTRINAFARGAGVMGEAGAEAIMPLRRGADGRLGVEMYRDDAGKPSVGAVTVNIINGTGEQVTRQTRTDNYGNKTIDVMIGDAAAKQAAKPGSAMNRAIRGVTGVQTPVIRR